MVLLELILNQAANIAFILIKNGLKYLQNHLNMVVRE